MELFMTFFVVSFCKNKERSFPPNYRIENGCQLLDICNAMLDWPKVITSWVFTKNCVFSLPCNFLKLGTNNFQKN
jgi:hypothetical protein